MDIITYALCKKADKEIIDMIQSMEKLTITVVDEVPTVETAEPNRLYLVDTNHDGTYEMYILAEVEGEEEVVELGPVVDFSDYYTKEQIEGMVTPIRRLSDSEYTALTTAQKNNGTLYLVYESVIDNRSVTSYSNGEWYYTTEIYGVAANNDITFNKYASDKVTTAPTLVAPQYSGTHLVFKTTTSEGTYYHNNIFLANGGTFSPSAGGRADDSTASNITLSANNNSYYQVICSYGGSGRTMGDLNQAIIQGRAFKSNGKTAIYYKSEKYAETKPDATDVVYSNATSGLSATNVQAAIDELNTNDVGKKEYVNNELKGEVFNVYTGNGKNIASGDQSHAEGLGTTAEGSESHAEGLHTTASGNMSHAEGNTTKANGSSSHTEGDNTIANGGMSHAEGYGTITKGQSSHAEGLYTITVRNHSHAEGDNTVAIGVASHTEGVGTKALEQASHAGGYYTKSAKKYETVIGKYNLPFEDTDLIVSELIDNSYYLLTIPVYKIYYYNSYTLSATSIAIPNELKEHLPSSVGDYGIPYVICDNNKVETELWGCLKATAAGEEKTASISILPSNQNYLKNYNSSNLYIKVYADTTQLIDAYWKKTTETIPDSLFVIGNGRDGGNRSNIVEVNETSLNVNGDIKQNGTTIDFSGSDVGKKEYVDNDGIASEIFNVYSGQFKNVASGAGSHAEGVLTVASNDASHTEGSNTVASGQYSHAEGLLTEAAGFASHASGYYTIANTGTSTVVGRYNVADGTGANDPKHLFIVGNGTATGARSNILEVSDSYLNVNGDIKQNGVALGSLAMKSSASDSYTPAGTVSTPTISATITSATVNSITAVGTLPTLTYDAVNKEYTFSAGTLPTKGDNVTVIASIDSLTSTQPTFTGTTATIEVS